MVRTATLDLNSRGSFVDDLNSKPGIVMCRDALLHRSHEIQPAFFDSEMKRTFPFLLENSFFFLLFFSAFWKSRWHPIEDWLGGARENYIFFAAPITRIPSSMPPSGDATDTVAVLRRGQFRSN